MRWLEKIKDIHLLEKIICKICVSYAYIIVKDLIDNGLVRVESSKDLTSIDFRDKFLYGITTPFRKWFLKHSATVIAMLLIKDRYGLVETYKMQLQSKNI